jgi:hypothetical protein
MTEKDIYRDTPVRLLGTYSLSTLDWVICSCFILPCFSHTSLGRVQSHGWQNIIFRRMGKCELHVLCE